MGTCDDPSQLVESLSSPHCELEHVQPHESLQYLNVMRALRAAKAEVGKWVWYLFKS